MSNGIVEKENCTVMDLVRSILEGSVLKISIETCHNIELQFEIYL